MAVLGSAVVVFAVLLFGARVLLARRAPVHALWPAAVLDAAARTLALNLGGTVASGGHAPDRPPVAGEASGCHYVIPFTVIDAQ